MPSLLNRFINAVKAYKGTNPNDPKGRNPSDILIVWMTFDAEFNNTKLTTEAQKIETFTKLLSVSYAYSYYRVLQHIWTNSAVVRQWTVNPDNAALIKPLLTQLPLLSMEDLREIFTVGSVCANSLSGLDTFEAEKTISTIASYSSVQKIMFLFNFLSADALRLIQGKIRQMKYSGCALNSAGVAHVLDEKLGTDPVKKRYHTTLYRVDPPQKKSRFEETPALSNSSPMLLCANSNPTHPIILPDQIISFMKLRHNISQLPPEYQNWLHGRSSTITDTQRETIFTEALALRHVPMITLMHAEKTNAEVLYRLVQQAPGAFVKIMLNTDNEELLLSLWAKCPNIQTLPTEQLQELAYYVLNQNFNQLHACMTANVVIEQQALPRSFGR